MPWHLLDIRPSRDEREIRRAYARQLKTRQHENDPEYFARLRQAYEEALEWARDPEREEEIHFSMEPLLKALERDFQREESIAPGHPEEFPQETGNGEVPVQNIPDAETIEDSEENPPTIPVPDIPDPETMKEPRETLESLLRVIEAFFVKNQESTLPWNVQAELLLSWQRFRNHPCLESLAASEEFSERLAVLLSEHWPASQPLCDQARDLFGWQYPVPSDHSPQADALRTIFIEREKPSPADADSGEAPEKQRDGWFKRYLYLVFLPFHSFYFLARAFVSLLGAGEASPEGKKSFFAHCRDLFEMLIKTTILIFRFCLGFLLYNVVLFESIKKAVAGEFWLIVYLFGGMAIFLASIQRIKRTALLAAIIWIICPYFFIIVITPDEDQIDTLKQRMYACHGIVRLLAAFHAFFFLLILASSTLPSLWGEMARFSAAWGRPSDLK